jgi:hypothetical protein
LAPLVINRVACPPSHLKSTANGSADPVATLCNRSRRPAPTRTLSLVHLWKILGHSRPPLTVAIRRCHWSTLRMKTMTQRTSPSSHPPLSPYHTGRLSCVFRGGNVSGSMLMIMREFWTPSLSNPPHSPLHMQRLSCLFWGGNINCRPPSFCRIEGWITSG